MPGNLDHALLLLEPNLTTAQSYTFSFATEFANAGVDSTKSYRATPNGPLLDYYYDNDDFVSVDTLSRAIFSDNFAWISSYSGLTFSEDTQGRGDIHISGNSRTLLTDQGVGIPGYAYFPQGTADSSDIYLNAPALNSPYDLRTTIAHELGHAIGLRHSSGQFTEDNGAYTMMSYNPHASGPRDTPSPQLYDIAAIQAIYGRNDSHASGNTTYSAFTEVGGTYNGQDRLLSIWDGGGVDTIDASGTPAKAALIDLRPGHFSSIGPFSAVSATVGPQPALTNADWGNVSIAFGAYIENATGGDQGDVLIGNLFSNTLTGGEGDDILYAEGAAITHSGVLANAPAGDGDYRRVNNTEQDHVEDAPLAVAAFVADATLQEDILLGGDGNDYLVGGRGRNELDGGSGTDFLFGGDGGDELIGGADNDYIRSGPGGTGVRPADTIDGGGGNDVVIVDTGSFAFVETGTGADQIWVGNSDSDLDLWTGVVINESDGADSLYWNGYKLAGGTTMVVDLEQYAPDDYGWYEGGVDGQGVVYTWWADNIAITIYLPDGGFIDIMGFENGDYGISFDSMSGTGFVHVDRDENGNIVPDSWTSNLQFSNIVLDDNEGNWQDLTGGAYAVENPGGWIEPTTFLM